MKISDTVKETRLHRLYQVVFWILLILPFPAIALSLLVQVNTSKAQVATDEWARNAGISYEARLPTILASNRTIDLCTIICFISLAVIILAMVMPILYRLLLYILHGKAAFTK